MPNALIVSLDDSRVLSLQGMTSVLSRLYGAEALAEGDKPFSTIDGYCVVAVPEDGRPRFQAMGMDHSIALEGTQEAIDLVLAEVRQVLPDDHPRVIGVQSEHDLYVDLPVGVTAGQVTTGWKEIDAGLDDFS